MKISVVIPTFNRVDCIGRAIASVQSQSLAVSDADIFVEVIVVDDGSTDATEGLIRRDFPDVIYLKQLNQGVSAARNAGIKLAKGDWIALLDSDDEWLPDKLAKQVELLKSTELLVCHTQEIWIRNGIRVNQMKKHKKVGGWIYQNCLPLCAMSPSSILIHRQVFDEVGLFDESLPACEDYDLWLRICSKYEVAFESSACINKYGGHDDQLSRKYWGMDRFRVIALDKMLSQPLSVNDKLATIEILTKKLSVLLKGAIKHKNNSLAGECDKKLAHLAQIAAG